MRPLISQTCFFEIIQSAVRWLLRSRDTDEQPNLQSEVSRPCASWRSWSSKFDSVYVNQGLRWRTDFFDLPKSSMNGDYRRQNPDNRTASAWRLAQAARLMGIRDQGLVVSVRLLAVPSWLIAESLNRSYESCKLCHDMITVGSLARRNFARLLRRKYICTQQS